MGSDPKQRLEAGFVSLARDAYKGDLEGLFYAGEAIEGLLQHPGWDLVARLVALEVGGLDAALDGRLLDTRSEYARLTGRRAGLRGFEAAAHAIVAEAARQLAEQQRKHEGMAAAAMPN